MLTRIIIRRLSKLPEKFEKPSQRPSEKGLILSTIYKFSQKAFPKMLPRLMRFEWSDLVIYCEIFFIGLMVYIHFIDP